jgi:hypothetical protein
MRASNYSASFTVAFSSSFVEYKNLGIPRSGPADLALGGREDWMMSNDAASQAPALERFRSYLLLLAQLQPGRCTGV